MTATAIVQTVAVQTATNVGFSLPTALDLGNVAKTLTHKKTHTEHAMDALNGVNDGFNLCCTGLSFVQKISAAAFRALGIVGASLSLACDTVALAQRLLDYRDIARQKEEIPKQAVFKKLFVDAQQKQVEKLIESSVMGVATDCLGVVFSVIPILNFIICLIAFIVTLIMIQIENEADQSFQEKLQEITLKYEKHHPKIVYAKETFKERHLQLQAQYEQAKMTKQETAVALEDATNAMRQLPHKGSMQAQQEATKKDVLAEQALKSIEAEFQASTIALMDLEAYEEAMQLLIELDPLLQREHSLKNAMEKYETAYPLLQEKEGIAKFSDKLQKQLEILTQDLIDYRLTNMDAFPYLKESEYTRKQEHRIAIVHAQLQDLNAYVQARENLERHYRVMQANFSRT